MLDLVLDSGAFTAWSKGQPVDIDEYCAYIKHNAEGIDHYVALDVIPGEFGRVPTPAEVEASAAQGWENLLYMQREGLDPVPVFHQGEQFKWLHRMIAHGCKYIGISPANDRTTGQKRVWLDRVFTEIVDKDGWPVVKTHAFGMTAVSLLMRYPWYSADSATWVLASGRGSIMVPHAHDGEFLYSRTPQVIFTTPQAEAGKSQKTLYRDLSPARREQVDRFVAEAGTTVEECRHHHKPRARVNAHFFMQVGAKKVDKPWKPHRQHLFKDL